MTDKDSESTDARISDQERETAANALNEFNKSNYTGCLQHLSKLLENRPQDPKVLHNKAVTECYRSDLTKTDQFRKSLTSVFVQAKIKQDVCDDVEQCVFHFNQAVLLYHQQKYVEALRIVDRIYKFIEPMDEKLAHSVCLLLIELHLCTQEHKKALTLINCIENQFVNSKSEQKEGDKKEQKVQKLDGALEEFKKKLLYYRCRCLLMSHALKVAKKELKILSPNDTMNTAMICLKSQWEYLRGNHKNAIKLLNCSPTDCLTIKENGESGTVIFYNNMGVIHYAMGKPNLACHYFRQALKEDQVNLGTLKKNDNDGRALHTIGSAKYHEIMYNLGIALLHSGHPLQAFDCLIIAVQRYHRNSRLWLRIAECCIQVHKSSNEVDFNLKRQKEIISDVVGTDKHRKIILKSNLSKDAKYSTDTQSYAVPVATLEFASLCLRNALLLLPSEITSSPVLPFLLPGGVQPPPPPPNPSPAPSTPLNSPEVASLRNSVLVASAYVTLCLGDYVLTLEHAQLLLKQNKLSGVHRLLGHLYAAEALVLMDKLTDAVDHLNPDLITDIGVDFPKDETADEEDICKNTKPASKWFPETLGTAHAVLQYNLAVTLTIRGELERAADLLRRIWQSRTTHRVPIHVVMLFLYTELQLGHVESARSLIKQYSSLQR